MTEFWAISVYFLQLLFFSPFLPCSHPFLSSTIWVSPILKKVKIQHSHASLNVVDRIWSQKTIKVQYFPWFPCSTSLCLWLFIFLNLMALIGQSKDHVCSSQNLTQTSFLLWRRSSSSIPRKLLHLLHFLFNLLSEHL